MITDTGNIIKKVLGLDNSCLDDLEKVSHMNRQSLRIFGNVYHPQCPGSLLNEKASIVSAVSILNTLGIFSNRFYPITYQIIPL